MRNPPPPPRRWTPDEFAHAFAALAPRLWCVAAAALGQRQGAEDVLQEAALTALGKLSSFAPGSSFPAWMGKIVRFTALNAARRQRRRREVDPGLLEATPARAFAPVLPWPQGAGAADPELFDDVVTRALAELGTRARECFLLRVLSGATYDEIAALLGIPAGTAMSDVSRSRRFLRDRLLADAAFEPAAAWRAS